MPAFAITVTANYELIPPNPLVIKNGVVLLYTGNGKNQLSIPKQWREENNGNTHTVHTIGSYDTNDGIVFIDPNMAELDLPDTINTILPTVFNGASGLEKITVEKDNKNFETDDGILYNKGKTKLWLIRRIKKIVHIKYLIL